MAHALRADDFADAGRDPQVLAPDGFLTLAPIGAMFLAFLLCGHYTRRLPSWREARHVTEAAAVAGILGGRITLAQAMSALLARPLRDE